MHFRIGADLGKKVWTPCRNSCTNERVFSRNPEVPLLPVKSEGNYCSCWRGKLLGLEKLLSPTLAAETSLCLRNWVSLLSLSEAFPSWHWLSSSCGGAAAPARVPLQPVAFC